MPPWFPSSESISRRPQHRVITDHKFRSRNLSSQLPKYAHLHTKSRPAYTMAENAAAAAEDFVLLRCFDGEEFLVPTMLARRSGVVAARMDAGDHAAAGAVPVPGGVAGRVLAAVIAYWIGRHGVSADGAFGRYDEEYVAGLSHDLRVDIINAAFHLSEHGLFELFGPRVAPCA